MNPESTILYLQKSLRMRIVKKLVLSISENPLQITVADEKSVSMCMCFSHTDALSEEDTPEVGEEGVATIPHGWNDLLNLSEVIDILIVDDIEFNISVLRRLLEKLHTQCVCGDIHREYTIHSAGSGKQALEAIERQNALGGGYRLIIMDCLMPEMDGWQTTIKIRNLFLTKKIMILPFIVAYSAFDSREDANKSQAAGMSDHISKPCTQTTLCQVLSKWLRQALNVELR